jgi:1-aminocyclopropane-1-carboxylate deaminase/D-cysteine desulfhydrase-like pyridoxal-dependent ACC family enzyme
MSNPLIFKNAPFVRIQELQHPILLANSVRLGIARLDEIDHLTGGNKWFKLKYNITYIIDYFSRCS